MFKVGDIVRLKEDTLFYDAGLLCKIIKVEPFNHAEVEIIGGTFNSDIGSIRFADLKLFELVKRRRDGLYI